MTDDEFHPSQATTKAKNHTVARIVVLLMIATALIAFGCTPIPANPGVAYQCEREMRMTQTPWFSRGLLDVIQDRQFYADCVRARETAL
jgi:hypothetical protein